MRCALILTRSPLSLARRLLLAAHQACDEHDLPMAAALLGLLELELQLGASAAERHAVQEALVAAHETLWSRRGLSQAALAA